jgi:hypothetical protein
VGIINSLCSAVVYPKPADRTGKRRRPIITGSQSLVVCSAKEKRKKIEDGMNNPVCCFRNVVSFEERE